jgi:hypothetical protein
VKEPSANRSLGDGKRFGDVCTCESVDFTKDEYFAMGRRNLVELQPTHEILAVGVLLGIARSWALFPAVSFEQAPPPDGRAQV